MIASRQVTLLLSTTYAVHSVDLIMKNVSLRIRYSPRDEIRNFWSSSSVLCTVDSMNNISGVLAREARAAEHHG